MVLAKTTLFVTVSLSELHSQNVFPSRWKGYFKNAKDKLTLIDLDSSYGALCVSNSALRKTPCWAIDEKMLGFWKQIELSNIEPSMTSWCLTVRHATCGNMAKEISKQKISYKRKKTSQESTDLSSWELTEFDFSNGNATIYYFPRKQLI